MQFDPKVNPDAAEVLRKLFEFKNVLVESNKAFSKGEFLKGLKEIGLPSNCHFWMTVLSLVLPTQQCKLLTKVCKDGYVFTKPKEPIYYGDLQALYDAYSKTTKKYQQTYKEKKRQLKCPTSDSPNSDAISPSKDKEEFERLLDELRNTGKKEDKASNEQLSAQIQEAIELLKAHGYQILAPVATLYVKM